MFAEVYALVRRLLQHDEVVRAREVLRNVPWDLQDDPRIADLRLTVDAQLRHLDDSEVYWNMYANYLAEVEAIPLPGEVRPEWSQHVRFSAVMAEIEAAKAALAPTYLDIGCYDGAFTNRAGLRGAVAFGIDCSVTAVHLANRKAAEFSTGARHARCRFPLDPLPPDFPAAYDVVSACEVYEHVPDTRELCRSLRPLVAPGGALVLTTPHGSWLRGTTGQRIGPRWDTMEPREHVRAPLPDEVARDLLTSGFREVRVQVAPIPQAEVPGQATIVAIAR